jgi:hypothetical protein
MKKLAFLEIAVPRSEILWTSFGTSKTLSAGARVMRYIMGQKIGSFY